MANEVSIPHGSLRPSTSAPVVQKPIQPQSTPQTAQSPLGHRISHVVDDEPAVREFLSAILHLEHFQSVEAEDGAKGLQIVQELGDDVVLIVSDIHMPNGDGVTFAHAVKAAFPAVPIILVSGCAEPDPEFSFLRKPLPPSALLNAIRSLVSDELMAVLAGDR